MAYIPMLFLTHYAEPVPIKAFRSEWEGEQPELYVMDAAFYSEANLQEYTCWVITN